MTKSVDLRQEMHLSSFGLKCVAIIAMTIDHIGYLLIPPDKSMLFRMVGRIAFPIFCFLIVEGYFYTRNITKYALRLFAFALISEVPYDLAVKKSVFNMSRQNVFFTLLIGLLTIAFINKCTGSFLSIAKKYKPKTARLVFFISVLAFICSFATLASLYLALKLRVDYSLIGLPTILSFYVFRRYQVVGLSSIAFINLRLSGGFQAPAVLAAIPLLLYNGEKGKPMRWLFYIFYPAHLMCLYLLRLLIY
ncbi:MAG: TraX family protein [Oscillospiraceae bacterium]|nr:TraX family protein [Oscillospiraceae bacterium]